MNDTYKELMELKKYSAIRYWLVAPDPGQEMSPFQGYGMEILSPEFTALINIAAILPTHPADLLLAPKELAKLRWNYRPSDKAIISESLFQETYQSNRDEATIEVVLGLPAEIKRTMKYVDQDCAVFVSTSKINGVESLGGWDGHPSQLIDHRLNSLIWPDAVLDSNRVGAASGFRAALPPGEHPPFATGVTIPNEVLCLSLGAPFASPEMITPGEPGSYVEAIIRSADRARSYIGCSSTDLVLYAPSLVREHYQFDSAFWNRILRQIKNKKARAFVRDAVFRNKHYSGFSTPDPEGTTSAALRSDPVLQAVVGLRQSELRICSAGIASLCCSVIAPALRLPNSLNFSLGLLQEIERHWNSDELRSKGLAQKNFRLLTKTMVDDIDHRLLHYVRDHGEAITIVADFPVEWIRIEGIPVMFRHETSRVPMTPGNLMLTNCLETETIRVPSSALHDVLVIRSFRDDDPVRVTLEYAVGRFPIKRLRTTFVDVQSRDEMVECLNEFQGLIVIFDCHGGHGGQDGHGWLHIGQEKVDTWTLAGEARIPPIVILSACSTFALSGSHASVANGLLRSGATTVLGTFLPVDAIKSAIFSARLLYRVDEFLPALSRLDLNYVTWRSLVSTFFRMSYCTDLLHFLRHEKNLLSEELSSRIGISCNYDVNNLNPKWHTRLIRRLSVCCKLPSAQIMQIIEDEHALTETMLYVQTGRPERIGILIEREE